MRQYFSDLLLRVQLKQDTEVFIYILLEHKSAPDDFVALQLLLYLARIWQPHLRKRVKPLPRVRSEELPTRLREIFETIKQLPKRRGMGYIKTILLYLLSVANKLTEDLIRQELRTVLPDQEGEIMKTLAEKWIQEGEQRGEQKAAAKLILRLLNRRFGILEARLAKRIRALSTEQLENLSEALFDFKAESDLLAWLSQEIKPETQQ